MDYNGDLQVPSCSVALSWAAWEPARHSGWTEQASTAPVFCSQSNLAAGGREPCQLDAGRGGRLGGGRVHGARLCGPVQGESMLVHCHWGIVGSTVMWQPCNVATCRVRTLLAAAVRTKARFSRAEHTVLRVSVTPPLQSSELLAANTKAVDEACQPVGEAPDDTLLAHAAGGFRPTQT